MYKRQIEEGAKVESTYMGMFNVTSMGGKIVMSAGTEEQKQYYAGLLQKGYISAFCLTEPNAVLTVRLSVPALSGRVTAL